MCSWIPWLALYCICICCKLCACVCCRLQLFVDQLCDGFIKECPELMRREFERKGVKLHATLINSKFLSGDTEELEVYRGMRRQKTSTTVDATALFKVCTSNVVCVCVCGEAVVLCAGLL